ncbi:S-layer homology domain-containing protein [Dysosmobacter sp. Marseille-Q4140]|nr:S-layer homology domain-containing protein [Dysosmobacter sp. Marseille-Q4140]
MKKFLSLVLALVMAMSLVTVSAGAKDFTDSDSISGDEYAEAIDVMSALEIIDGYAGGAFQPQGTLTRGAAAKIIACMMLGKTTAEALGSQAAPFKDVPAGSTFAGYIAYCVEAGIIDGYADGTFRPSNKLTGFAFLKMLLTAMGYDSAVEGFTGTNWTVNVARRAIENGLTDGNDEFVGTDLATREEACLYAVNTIKATLVEYEYKGSSVTINGVEISQGASSPKVVTSVNAAQATSINGEQYVTGATGQQATYTVEFGEKYMPKLSLKGDTDSFMRPSHIWNYKGVEIGEYTDEADLEYTKKVTSNDIYDDLGLTETVVAATYEDGVAPGTFTVKNNDVNNKIGGKGVLTQVFKSGHWEAGKWVTDVTITKVNTYVGDVVSKTAATSVKDAYVTVVARSDKAYPGGTFTTDSFSVDDVVVYNYSYKTGEAGVKNLAVAETVTGTLTSFTTGDSATVGGTKYDYAAKYAREAGVNSVNTDITVVLDPYGYAIDVDAAEASYAVVLRAVNTGLRPEATLLFTDGTVKDVVLAAAYTGDADIVTYTIKSNDQYALTKANASAGAQNITASITNGSYAFTTNGTTNNYTANGKTIFLVRTMDANGNSMYAAYEGIKNVPTINKTSTTGFPVSVYCKTGNLATVVYVDARGASVLNPASDVVFIEGNDDNHSYTTGIGSFHKYTAVLNGELKDEYMTAAVNYVGKDKYDLFDGVYYDANGVATLSKSNSVIAGKGVYKEANEVLGTTDVTAVGNSVDYTPNNYAYYPVADNCFVVLVDEDGTITTGLTIGAVVKDSNDLIYFKRNASGEISSAYIVKVAGGEYDGTTPGTVDTANYQVNVSGTTVTVSYYASAAHDEETILGQIRAKLSTMGYTTFEESYAAPTWTIKASNPTTGATRSFTWNTTLNTGAFSCLKIAVDGVSMLVPADGTSTKLATAVPSTANMYVATVSAGVTSYTATSAVTVTDGASYDTYYAVSKTVTTNVTGTNAAEFVASPTATILNLVFDSSNKAYIKSGSTVNIQVTLKGQTDAYTIVTPVTAAITNSVKAVVGDYATATAVTELARDVVVDETDGVTFILTSTLSNKSADPITGDIALTVTLNAD